MSYSVQTNSEAIIYFIVLLFYFQLCVLFTIVMHSQPLIVRHYKTFLTLTLALFFVLFLCTVCMPFMFSVLLCRLYK